MAGLALGLAIPGIGSAHAETTFPDRPLQMIVAFPPGGAADILARLLAAELGPRLGQSIVIVNRPGGGTSVGAQAAAISAPDGYTLFMASNSVLILNPATRENLPFDTAHDFVPLAEVGTLELMLITPIDNPVQSVAGLIAAAKSAPGKLLLASYGSGTISQFAGELFKEAAGITMTHVPYKGSAPAMSDLLAGHIPYLVDTVVAVKPQAAAGKVRPLAIFAAKRSPLLPDVPTIAECGIHGAEIGSWNAIVVPKGVPDPIRATLTEALRLSMQSPDLRTRFLAAGIEPEFKLLEGYPAMITSEIARMRAIAQKAGIKAE